MNSCVSTRREMLKKALLGSIALPLLGSVRLSGADAANAAPSDVGVAPPEGRSSPPRNPMTRSEGVGGSGTAPGVGQGADGSIATGRVKLLSLRVSHSLERV